MSRHLGRLAARWTPGGGIRAQRPEVRTGDPRRGILPRVRTVIEEATDVARERSRRRAEGPASRWRPVPGLAPARVPKPRQRPYLAGLAASAGVAATQLGAAGADGLLGILGAVLAVGCAVLAWAERRRHVARCALPPGDATVTLTRTAWWRMLRRAEIATELVRSVGATWPQALSIVRSPQATLVVEVDHAVAHALASRLRATGATVEVTGPV